MFLKVPEVRLEQAKRSFGIPRIDARCFQTDYAAFLLLYDPPSLGDEFLSAAKIVLVIHLLSNAQASDLSRARRAIPGPAGHAVRPGARSGAVRSAGSDAALRESKRIIHELPDRY